MSLSVTDIEKRAAAKEFMKSDLDAWIAQMELQEVHRMQAREIHWKVICMRSTSNVVDIRGWGAWKITANKGGLYAEPRA